MIAQRVKKESELKAELTARGCVETSETTGTGTIWKTSRGLHFIVPFSLEGYYADWMLWDLYEVLSQIEAESDGRRKS